MARVILKIDKDTERLFRLGLFPWLPSNPVKVTKLGDRVILETWKCFRRCVKRHLRTWQGDLLSQDALDALKQAISGRMTRMGYEVTVKRVWEYACTSPAEVWILPSTKSLTDLGEEIENNATECDLGDLRKLRFPTYVTLEEGRIVSVATCNGHPDDNGMCEVGMETYEGARGRGYATSNLAALAQHLVKEGNGVVASVEKENIASHRALSRAGFERVGESVYYIGEKNGV